MIVPHQRSLFRRQACQYYGELAFILRPCALVVRRHSVLYILYSSCALKIGTSQTKSFSYSRGVRQGCILSPLLFNLYVNDLPSAFQNTLSDPIILPNGTKLNSLLYADDLIIISRSKIGLQNCLNTLSSFCNSWMLDINSKKTKVMVFQKRAKKTPV